MSESTYLSPSLIAGKICPLCGNKFDGHLAKVYCSLRCRDKAKLKRQLARDAAAHPKPVPTVGEHMIIQNPTVIQLEEYASKIADGTITTAILFRGTIPEWTAYKYPTVVFARQFDGAVPKDPDEFSMFHERLLD